MYLLIMKQMISSLLPRQSALIKSSYKNLNSTFKRWQSSSSSLSYNAAFHSMDEQARTAYVLQAASVLSSSSSPSPLSSALNGKGGLSFAMALREDTLKLMEAKPPSPALPELKKLDSSLKDWLSIALCADNLTLRRIEFDKATGDTLEKVVTGEAVHAIHSLEELKRRLHNGRRCFGLFHISMPTTPLAFVHIALTPALAPSLTYLNQHYEVSQPTSAMFYSVNSPFASLTGLDMAVKVIKSATFEYIKANYPTVTTFCTLSPVPGFNSWLLKLQNNNKIDGIVSVFPKSYEGSLRSAVSIYNSSISNTSITSESSLKDIFTWMISNLQPQKGATDNSNLPGWVANQSFCDNIKPTLLWLAAHYIANEKASSSSKLALPLDPVARFHLRNGSAFHCVNWMGNPNLYGIKASLGVMVNYLYDMDNGQQRADEFEQSNGRVRLGEQVSQVLSGKLVN